MEDRQTTSDIQTQLENILKQTIRPINLQS